MTLMRFTILQLAIAAVLAFGVYLSAQVPIGQSPGIIAGPDIGFQVERTERGRVIGRLMVRVNDEWLPAQFSDRGRIVPLDTK